MFLWNIIKGRFFNARRIRDDANDERRNNRRGVHSFSSSREHALSDIRRARMLLEAEKNESGRNSDCSSRNTIRKLIPSLGELISKRTGESVDVIEWLVGDIDW